ncbi:hypothetical protein PEL8287_03289 [Roseovarius litorisediminis]|uniref:Polyketide cyclase / dehydrase and lipid transport n=1 Tax=Roseovarius litorisediminis TaxID=1312363 RepID=A0A1Y5TF47_9RHOB|nr:hypothetical protein [Roseovarius litorisediminis]SLN60494.1 hypothetical protein PEL8287_03289 [Roseovarius litorisediminis]
MNFSAKEDVEAPIDHVFAEVSNFQSFERSALRRGAEVRRVDDLTTVGPGMAWDIAFELRGKRRELILELTHFEPPNGMLLASRASPLGGVVSVDLVALSRNRTRINVDVVLKPQNLSARLLVQSLKLARANLGKRFSLRLGDYARDLENRLKRRA